MINTDIIMLLLMMYIAGHDLWQGIAHKRERKDMCDRLMSRGLGEYKAGTREHVKKPAMSAHDKAMNAWRSGGGDEQ